MSEWCGKYDVEIWAYCLMPNHVHSIAVPGRKESLNLAIAEAHKRYSRRINFREGLRGHLWQRHTFMGGTPLAKKLTINIDGVTVLQ